MVLILLMILIVGCAPTEPALPSMATEETNVVQAEPSSAAVVENPATTQQFSISAKQWEFSPSTITVKKGTTVKLTITSEDVAHSFTLSDFGVNEKLEPGKTVQVEFVADKSGEFTFLCKVFCGQGHSQMKGKLIVTE